ncbi:MAG TPA: class I SAM-dependent methyltransferase [Microvirga sp.]|jgi:SAM-dependent methyltransferase|nr:class I SAM-dependent methyltransferase [Microvirga sp.]
MTAHDSTTLGFYAAEAEAYAGRGQAPLHERLSGFLAALPPGGAVLELGCGAGQDSAAMLARGFRVEPTDGTPEIAREAERRLGIPVRVLLFGDLDAREAYDGVWANACLLHVPRRDLPAILARIHAALKAGGVFYASYKAGSEEGRDRFGRYFNYPSPDWLRQAYGPARWADIAVERADGSGYDNEPTEWLHVTAVKERDPGQSP